MTRDDHGVVHISHAIVGTLCYKDDGAATDEAPTCLWCIAIANDPQGRAARPFDIEFP